MSLKPYKLIQFIRFLGFKGFRAYVIKSDFIKHYKIIPKEYKL